MRLKFPDMTRIHAQFENPEMLKERAKDISRIAGNVLKKIEEPLLLKRVKDRIWQWWKV